jgi:hypothetical protein
VDRVSGDWTNAEAELLELIRQLYAIHPTGGPLHVQLDDGNLDGEITPSYSGFTDDELDALYYDGWLIAELPPEAPAVTEGLGKSTRQLCEKIAAKLNTMSPERRKTILGRWR